MLKRPKTIWIFSVSTFRLVDICIKAAQRLGLILEFYACFSNQDHKTLCHNLNFWLFHSLFRSVLLLFSGLVVTNATFIQIFLLIFNFQIYITTLLLIFLSFNDTVVTNATLIQKKLGQFLFQNSLCYNLHFWFSFHSLFLHMWQSLFSHNFSPTFSYLSIICRSKLQLSVLCDNLRLSFSSSSFVFLNILIFLNDFQIQITTLCVTISLSAYVTLICLYSPKLYIIILHPEKNVRWQIPEFQELWWKRSTQEVDDEHGETTDSAGSCDASDGCNHYGRCTMQRYCYIGKLYTFQRYCYIAKLYTF